MLWNLPLVFLLKWAVVIICLSSIVFYFRYLQLHYAHIISQSKGINSLASHINNAYFRTVSLCMAVIGALFLGYIIHVDTKLYRQERELHEQSKEMMELRETHNQTLQQLEMVEHDHIALANSDPSLDALKEKYEILFINHYILRKCGFHGQKEYARLNAIYVQETQKLSLPPNFKKNLLLAAKGSFEELYADTSCTAKHTRELLNQMDLFLENQRR